MIVCVQQCAAVEDGKDGLEIGCCCKVIKGGTAVLSAIVHSAAYVEY